MDVTFTRIEKADRGQRQEKREDEEFKMEHVGCGRAEMSERLGPPPASPFLRGQSFVSVNSSSKLLCFNNSLRALTVGAVAASSSCYLHNSSFLPFWLPN